MNQVSYSMAPFEDYALHNPQKVPYYNYYIEPRQLVG